MFPILFASSAKGKKRQKRKEEYDFFCYSCVRGRRETRGVPGNAHAYGISCRDYAPFPNTNVNVSRFDLTRKEGRKKMLKGGSVCVVLCLHEKRRNSTTLLSKESVYIIKKGFSLIGEKRKKKEE